MRIFWASARDISSDLSRTTQLSLISGLLESGHQVTLASPGKRSEEYGFEHIPLKKGSVKGLKSLTVAKGVRKIIPECEVIMVDWRLVPFLKSWLAKSGKPWYLVDRSPPADSGIIARLQWRYWKKAWKMSKFGMVVSSAHKELVVEKTETKAELDIIPVGVDSTRFFCSNISEEKVRFVYIGKVDFNRDVNKLPQMVIDVGGELLIVGKGDAIDKLSKSWGSHPNIKIVNSVSKEQIPSLLKHSDIGLLPMPNKDIWKIASPLKLAEYAASGLLVAGIDHEGNRPEFDAKWLFLAETLEEAIVLALNNYSDSNLRKVARKDAEKYFSWSNSVKIIEKTLQEIIA